MAARIGPLVSSVTPGSGPLARPETWSLALLAAAWVWAAREIARLLRRPAAPGTRADRAMATVALAGGALYLLHGSWMYTAGLANGAAWVARGGPAPSALPLLLFAGILAGAMLAARARGRFRPRRPRLGPSLRAVAGGTLMGLGAALVPGGNDALVLYALPAFLPHAALAYAALVAGAACTLLLLRALRGSGQGGAASGMARDANAFFSAA